MLGQIVVRSPRQGDRLRNVRNGLYPRSAQREDADFQTTAIHLCDASAAHVEDLLPKFGRWEVLFGVTRVDRFGQREVLFQGNFADRLRRLRLRRIHCMLAHMRGVRGLRISKNPCGCDRCRTEFEEPAPGDSIFLVCWLQTSFSTDDCVASVDHFHQ